MAYLLSNNPSSDQITQAVNYLLGNMSPVTQSNAATGEITSPQGQVLGYIYQYIYIRYSTSYDGSVGFSTSPTNATYYGLQNTNLTTASTNPADYVWYQTTGFGTTNYLWYLVSGGGSISFQVAALVLALI
jgi:hypothetical protein